MDTENKSQKSACPVPTLRDEAGEVRSQKLENETAIFYITNNGLRLAESLKRLYHDTRILKFNSEVIYELWSECKNLIFIMAAGIVVRTIAPLIKGKRTDPAVVVLDEKGEYAISLLGGHLGGANKIAKEIADFLGGRAVITTASDVNNLPVIDLWARENNLVVENWDLLPKIGTLLLNKGFLKVYADIGIKLTDKLQKTDNPETADILITNKNNLFAHTPIHLYLRPKNLIIGIGCNSGTSADEIEDAVKSILAENNLSFLSVYSIATIDKKSSEPGLIAFTEKYGFKVKTFTSNELNNVEGVVKSEAAFKATGAKAVAEPAALLASGAKKLLVPKQRIGNVTIAVAESVKELKSLGVKVSKALKETPILQYSNTPKIYIVGTGPGGIEHITPCAQNAIRKSDVIVGYETYLDLIKEFIKDKEVISTGMTQEVERCKKAVELALSGKAISVISGGDPGIYAMAGLVFEILKDRNALCVMRNALKNENSSLVTRHSSLVDVEVIPGISALNACAARLGAPLMHDFASISLSDRLTPWELIEKRLESAVMADFVIVLYNPRSMGRLDHINKARDIILKHKSPETPVGIVKSAMREGEKVVITGLKNMLDHNIDMQSTVIIGNSQTFLWEGWMITPRGYKT